MGSNNNNNQLAFHHHHQIGSFNPSRAGCSPIFSYLIRRPEPQKSGPMSSPCSNSKKPAHHDQEVSHEEPESPEVGCMGHIKKNGKGSNKKASQFRKMFSFSVKTGKVEDDNSPRGIGIADIMDRPLPVSSKQSSSSRNTEINSLWERRHGSSRDDLDHLDVVKLKLQAEARLLRHGFGCTRDLQA